MSTEYEWPVTSYSVTLTTGTGFGWIHLKDGTEDAGYIYFQKQPSEHGRFGGLNSNHPYVVMDQPISNWSVILDVLRHEKPLYISGYQANDGDPVHTFFGTSTQEPVGEGE